MTWRYIAGILCLCLFAFGATAAEHPILPIVIEGLSGKELENVTAALKLQPDLIEQGKIDESLTRHFEGQIPQKVRAALEPFGYYRPEVEVSRERTDEGLHRLLVRVQPGNPVRVGGARVDVAGPGAREPSLRQLVMEFPLRQGDILRHDLYDRAKEEFLKKAMDLGYLEAVFSVHAIRVSLERGTADIELILETGRLYRFGDIIFVGKPSYPESFLRRYLEFKPGDIFSYEQIAKTQANYANADRFREIAINAKKEGITGERIPVEIALSSSPAKSFRVGAGYGTDTGPRATVRYRDVNVAGRGQELETELKVSPILQGLSTRYIFPGERDFHDYTALTAGLQQEDTTTYLSKWIKLEAERARGFGPGKTGSVFLQARQENSTAGDQTTNTFLLMPGVRFSDLHYDDLIRPRKGFYYQAEVRGTHQLLGSSTGFVQFVSRGDLIIPLPAQFALLTRAEVAGTWQNDPAQDLPVSVRFFAGGDRSIRGYAYQSLGPKDSRGNVVGGRNLLVGSAELERYVGKSWGIAAFYDLGSAFDSLADSRVSSGAGMGLRYYSLIGPIRLDIARQLGVVEPDIRFHLTIGVGL